MAHEIVARKAAEGDAFWLLGGLYEVKVASAETDGAMVVMQMTVPEGMGPPPHTHPGAETVYVLDGTCRFRIGEDTVEGGPGSVFHLPAGVLETFEPVGTARVLSVYTPGGDIDRFFAEVGERAPVRALPPPSEEPPDVGRMIAVGARYGIDMRLPG
ncbi:cupin domain-containing protein [Actinomadura roseirufa]|uniref:cupin domain-containing protein n=1 Tax=Actinomadura roseirufa TaxID=2094049 RepID=UPI0010414E30|nr:cupin domain-containing protein [Actinomadura roseirufa]